MNYKNHEKYKREQRRQKRRRTKGDDLKIKPLSKAELHEKRTPKGLADQQNHREATEGFRQRRRVQEIEMERQRNGRKDWRIPLNRRRFYATSKDA